MANIRLVAGNWYKFRETDGAEHIGQYIGNQTGFECCVCGKGHKAKTFNIFYDADGGYETWGYGAEHMPEIIEDLGNQETVIVDA